MADPSPGRALAVFTTAGAGCSHPRCHFATMPDDRKPDPAKPWERPNPKRASKRAGLTAAQKKAARARAEKAGRAYPNLVDNMWATKQPK